MNFTKKRLWIFIITGLSIILISGCARDITGSGTEEDPFIIHNFRGLEKIGKEESYSLSSHYRLGDNIDAAETKDEEYNEGKGWDPIGEYDSSGKSRPFTGSFDGQNYEIKDLKINRSEEEVIGLFSYIEDGVVINLGIDTIDITGKRYVGGIVGYNKGVIKNTYTEGKINGEWITGGLAGWNFSGTIENSNSASEVEGIGRLGGLAGYNSSAVIEKSYATGDIEGKDWNVGGLVGTNREKGIITRSYARGSVKGYARVGGLTGVNTGIVKRSYSTGKVAGEWLTGGLIGWTFDGVIEESYWDKIASDQDNSNGGRGRNTEEMQNKDNYRNWDFEKNWEIEGNQSYPEHIN
ncbi:MAG: GLUG motif-containing protein [Halanaerobiaceae bacterium]